MRGLIAFALFMMAGTSAYAVCPGTITDCPSPTYNNATVGGTLNFNLQGKPVATTPAPTSNQVLQFNGTNWVPGTVSTTGGANPGGSNFMVQINSNGTAFAGVPLGNAGQVLISGGPSAAPSFVDPLVSAIAGGYADGAIVTQGSKADAPNCATGNTEIACLRQLDADVKGSIPAGSAIIGGINNLPATVDTNAGAPTANTIRTVPATGATTATYPGTLLVTTLDFKATAATAQNALSAGHATKGGFIKNPDASTAVLCINQLGTAVAGGTSGDTICIAAGQTYQIIPSANAVSVISADSAVHAFGGYGFQ